MWNTIKQFYNSQEWQRCRLSLISERSPEGIIHCEYCGKIINSSGDAEIDHVKELTLDNVNDFNISLNPQNLKISCKLCHNKKHKRFGTAKEHNVYIVFGPPMSGKTTYVKENMERGDIVVDMDRLFSAISLFDLYDKPETLKYNIFAVRNTLLDNIKTRYGKWNNAWIIGGYSNVHDRTRLADELGAELIFIDTPKEVCIKRLDTCCDLRYYQKSDYKMYIDKWFDEFTLPGCHLG